MFFFCLTVYYPPLRKVGYSIHILQRTELNSTFPGKLYRCMKSLTIGRPLNLSNKQWTNESVNYHCSYRDNLYNKDKQEISEKNLNWSTWNFLRVCLRVRLIPGGVKVRLATKGALNQSFVALSLFLWGTGIRVFVTTAGYSASICIDETKLALWTRLLMRHCEPFFLVCVHLACVCSNF